MTSAPLTTPDMDIRDLDGFMLNVERLLASELWALTKNNPEAFRAAVALWARAWKQIPPASLPNEESILAAFSELTVKTFRKNRDLVMRGFELCSDGRFYHRVLAQEAQKIWPSVVKKRNDRQRDNERLKEWRERKRNERDKVNETIGETVDETRFETDETRVPNGVDTDTDRDRDITSKKERKGAALRAASLRGTRWPPDAVVPEDWIEAGRDKRAAMQLSEIDLRIEAELFANYWAAKSGSAATKVDWRRAWMNWVMNSKGIPKNGSEKRPNAHDNAFEGIRLLREEYTRRDEGEG